MKVYYIQSNRQVYRVHAGEDRATLCAEYSIPKLVLHALSMSDKVCVVGYEPESGDLHVCDEEALQELVRRFVPREYNLRQKVVSLQSVVDESRALAIKAKEEAKAERERAAVADEATGAIALLFGLCGLGVGAFLGAALSPVGETVEIEGPTKYVLLEKPIQA